MPDYPELTKAYADMLQQSELYKPTSFWDNASSQIVKDLNENGVEKFRSLTSILSYFVPTYGTPGNSYSPEMAEILISRLQADFPGQKKPLLGLKQFLSGYMQALSDYRVLKAADTEKELPYLHLFSESTFGEPAEQFEFEGRRFSRSSLNYLLGLAMLKKHLEGNVPGTILEIGGGFGTLGEIIASAGLDDFRYINIDIPPTSFVSQTYLSHVLGKEHVSTYEKTQAAAGIEINSLQKAAVLCSWQIERLTGKVDLFVNFISFQEMEPPVVKNYLDHVSRLETEWVLLRNMREGKNIRRDKNSVGVETPILGGDYLKMLPDYELIDRNVIPFGYKAVDDFHSELLLLRRKK